MSELVVAADQAAELRETARRLGRDVDELVALAIRCWLRPSGDHVYFGASPRI